MDDAPLARHPPYRGGVSADPSLTDDELQEEIDLVGALVLAASQAEGPMSQDRIDAVLGVPGPGGSPDGDGAPEEP